MTAEEQRALGRLEGEVKSLRVIVGRLIETVEGMRTTWWKIALAAASLGGGGGIVGVLLGGQVS